MPTTTIATKGPPPTGELGAPGIATFGGMLDTWEETAELKFPLSIAVFDRMRRTDGQTRAVVSASDLPILRQRRTLNGDGCDPRVVRFVADEFGLDLDNKAAARRRHRGQGIVFRDALRHAMLDRWLGFMPLEQVYEVDGPGPGQDGLGLPRNVAHIRKLAPRMPRTVTGIDVARDGGLEGIRQYVPTTTPAAGMGLWSEVQIPADRLVMFCHEREGGNWSGESSLRAAYGHWLMKVHLMKLGPMIAERNGMGVPIVNYGPDHDRNEALAIAKGFRAGETAGAALPEGMTLQLVGVTGSLRDELPLLKYHDESIGRAGLAMVLNLGHDHGAKALGDTLLELFLVAEGAQITDLDETFTEHAIRDLVELNYGPDEPYPLLETETLEPDAVSTATSLQMLAAGGLLDADPDLKAEIRRRFHLPPPDAAFVAARTGTDPAANTPPVVVAPGAPNLKVVAGNGIAAKAAALAQRAADIAAAHVDTTDD